jgi:hypothetical protein
MILVFEEPKQSLGFSVFLELQQLAFGLDANDLLKHC